MNYKKFDSKIEELRAGKADSRIITTSIPICP